MPRSLYRKELVGNPVLINGTRVPFQPLAGNRGVLALDDAKPEDTKLIEALNDLAARRKYGVVKITEEEFDSLSKKAQSFQPFTKRKLEKLKVMQPLLKPKQPSPGKDAPGANVPPTKPAIPESPKFNQFESDAGVALAREGKPLPEGASESTRHGYSIVDPATKLRTDGPTVEEFTKAGYKAENYPPQGYAAKSSGKVTPAFVPRTAPKPDAPVGESKPPATK